MLLDQHDLSSLLLLQFPSYGETNNSSSNDCVREVGIEANAGREATSVLTLTQCTNGTFCEHDANLEQLEAMEASHIYVPVMQTQYR